MPSKRRFQSSNLDSTLCHKSSLPVPVPVIITLTLTLKLTLTLTLTNPVPDPDPIGCSTRKARVLLEAIHAS